MDQSLQCSRTVSAILLPVSEVPFGFCYYVGLVCCFTLPGGGLQIVYFVHVPLFIVDLPLKVGLVVLQVVLILS